MKVFDQYSAYYDLLYRDKDYKGEVDYIDQLIQQYQPGTDSILDMGCGTGKHDFYLAKKGYTVDGIDLSDRMIEQAKANLSDQYQTVEDQLTFEKGDVRKYRNNKKYDVVISLFHVISYQTTNEDLAAAFSTAKAHLNPGGLFIFDYWYGPGVLTDLPTVRAKRLENDQIYVTRIAEPVIYPDENCVDVNYTVFVKDKISGGVEELKETHKMRYLFLPEIQQFVSGRDESTKQRHFQWLTFNQPALNWNNVSLVRWIHR